MQQIGLIIACVALVAAANQVYAIEYMSCDNGTSKMLSATIKGCEDAKGAACLLKVGSNFNINTTFVTHNPFEEATIFLDVYEDVGLSYINLFKKPACEQGIVCPSKADQTQSLALDVKISASVLRAGSNYRLRLASKAGDEFCVEFPLEAEE